VTGAVPHASRSTEPRSRRDSLDTQVGVVAMTPFASTAFGPRRLIRPTLAASRTAKRVRVRSTPSAVKIPAPPAAGVPTRSTRRSLSATVVDG